MDEKFDLLDAQKSNRPNTKNGTVMATKNDCAMFELFGGNSYRGVAFTKSQMEDLWKYYGFDGRFNSKSDLENDGAVRNLFRHIESDGLRLMAFLSKYLEREEDPVQMIAMALSDAGFDIDFDE